jgi:NAD(P)-dependent dehydrogenase (short-subunit alcohol dehydrogenase family)
MCAASKDGILSLTRAMALELAPCRIRVNTIALGLTDTVQARYGSSEAEIIEIARSDPARPHCATGGDRRTAVFLASKNAGFVIGQALHVTGVPIWRQVRWPSEESA